MKKMFLAGIASLVFTQVYFAQSITYWSTAKEASFEKTGIRQIVPVKYLCFSAELQKLTDVLKTAPLDKEVNASNSSVIVALPSPDGSFQKFRVVESPIMAPELAAAYPNIRTYSIKGIDDVYANGKLDITPFGIHAIVFSPYGDFYIDPYCVGNTTSYISYFKNDFQKDPALMEPESGPIAAPDNIDGKGSHQIDINNTAPQQRPPAPCAGTQLRTYRLAVACTGEYAKTATGFASPTKAQTLARVVTSVNRVNGVYEKEVAVRLVLVANDTVILFTNPATDPFNGNNNAGTLISESQSVITTNIGTANFDIGHTFSTGGGGLAQLGCVCSANQKARGITGSASPVGDPYDIDYVAHEIGHQFAGNHTFNAITSGCNGNRNPSTSVEPGSGVTIMAYAGLCGSNNVAGNSIANFHATSYDEIYNFISFGGGAGCAVLSSTGNNPPVVTTNLSYAVPKSTPFILTGSATDPDGDALLYSWEETDAGTTGGNWNSGNAPFFRSYTPTVSATRLFPRQSVVASGNYTGTIGEFLPNSAQLLDFRLTARDNKAGGGGVCYTNVQVEVDSAGPFLVVYPSATGISWYINSPQTIMWNPAFTDQPPVSCDSVRILISYNSGLTYSTLVGSAPNFGFYNITAPNLSVTSTTCRIRIEGKGKVFYDIGNSDFTISLDPTVGLSEMSRSNELLLSVYPNPANDQVHIYSANLDNAGVSTLSIKDVTGREIYTKSFQQTLLRETIDLKEYQNGLYFVSLTNAGKQSIYRIVKQ